MNILDKRFKYVPAASTDIRLTFRKVRKELREADAKTAAMLKEKIAGRIGGGK